MGRAWVVVGAALLVLVALGAAVTVGATRGIDLAFTVWLQSFASPTLDRIADANTILGQATVDTAVCAVLAAVLLVRGPRWAWVAPAFIGLTGGIELAGKLIMVHPAPPDEFIRTSFNPFGFHFTTSSSFPSGHIARTTFLGLLVGDIWPSRALRIALAAIVIATPFLRIYLGDHWLSDALGGLAIGVIAGVLALRWLAFTRTGAR